MAKKGSAKKIARKTSKVLSLEDAVGEKMYTAWILMLKELVPHGRTHRLSVVVASMLQYASLQNSPKAERVTDLLQNVLDESGDGQANSVAKLAQKLFKDAKVKSKRTSSRGHGYSIVDDAIQEFIAWDNMPWER